MNAKEKAEAHLVAAHGKLLDFAAELGQGKWAGREADAAMAVCGISAEIQKATALIFATDDDAPSLDLH
ncbi:hypothetical protein AB6Q56_07510 [Dechloromonas sp. ARDL1]|uniref:hypothetical protein n=1 Tax=Dechloromonas sp. ARDL1 TaxID=3322121 RepID=UPI003DA766EA